MDFSNKVVLIVGGGSSIGAETAKYMARFGADLSLQGSNESVLKKVSLECKKLGGQEPLVTTGELTDEEQVRSLLERTVDKFGGLNVLVIKTGIFQFGNVESPDILNQYDYMFSVNVRPVIPLISSAVSFLEKTKGNIVNVSSFSGLKSIPNLLAYSMTKSSLNQLTRCVSLELASKQIRVNAVCPGMMDPPFYEESDISSTAYFDKLRNCYPLRRLGTPQEVASVIGYLASDEASFITGTTTSVDGGRHCLNVCELS